LINLIVPGTAMSETRKPTARHWNAFAECAGLELSAPQGGGSGEAFGLNAELIFGQQPLSGQGVSFRLGVKTGFLRVELEGCAIAAGTRFAMRDQPATVERTVKKEETESATLKAEGSAGGKLGLGPKGVRGEAEVGGKAAGGRSKEQKASYTHEGTEEIHKVTARGTNTEPSWEIRDPDNPILDGRYLGLENLCEVMPPAKGYRITAKFACRKRDLDLAEIEYGSWFRTTTKEKLALAVVASELGKTLEDLDEGSLTLCRSHLTSPGGLDEQDE
jgi:hypothetical protein